MLSKINIFENFLMFYVFQTYVKTNLFLRVATNLQVQTTDETGILLSILKKYKLKFLSY